MREHILYIHITPVPGNISPIKQQKINLWITVSPGLLKSEQKISAGLVVESKKNNTIVKGWFPAGV